MCAPRVKRPRERACIVRWLTQAHAHRERAPLTVRERTREPEHPNAGGRAYSQERQQQQQQATRRRGYEDRAAAASAAPAAAAAARLTGEQPPRPERLLETARPLLRPLRAHLPARRGGHQAAGAGAQGPAGRQGAPQAQPVPPHRAASRLRAERELLGSASSLASSSSIYIYTEFCAFRECAECARQCRCTCCGWEGFARYKVSAAAVVRIYRGCALALPLLGALCFGAASSRWARGIGRCGDFEWLRGFSVTFWRCENYDEWLAGMERSPKAFIQ